LVTGIIPDLIGEIFQEAGYTHQYIEKPLPWNRALLHLKHGKLNIAEFIFDTKERREYLVYPKIPFFSERTGFIQNKDNRIALNDLEIDTLKQYKYVVVRGKSYGKKIDELIKGLDVETVYAEKQAVEMLSKGRIDFIIGDILANMKHAQILGYADLLEVNSKLIVETPNYFAISKKLPNAEKIVNDLGDALIRIIKDGRYDKVLAKNKTIKSDYLEKHFFSLIR